MLEIRNIKLLPSEEESTLTEKVAKFLNVPQSELKELKITKKSIDARKKDNLFFVYSVCVSVKSEHKHIKKPDVHIYTEEEPLLVPQIKKNSMPPVVVGSGPAGLFAALYLAMSNLSPIVIEMGKDANSRKKDIDEFFKTGRLNLNSNILFGEGGAGTFSDGKLTTGTKSPFHKFIIEQFIECGAPPEIAYLKKPHIGTDILISVVANLRKKIIKLGGEFRFSSTLSDILTEKGKITGAQITDEKGENYIINTNIILLAIGHSARDTFYTLYKKGVLMAKKPFSVGVRIEHLQKDINISQYGKFANNPKMPAADYKLSSRTDGGRGVYTFCMCPGGTVVPSASENGMVCTNGMSTFSRNLENANSALLVSVLEKDILDENPLSGIDFQRKLEASAYEAGGGGFIAPVQTVYDFLHGKKSTSFGKVTPSYPIGTKMADLSQILPDFVTEGLKYALLDMNKRLSGFSCPDAILTGVETRSSSPVRILREKNFESSSIKGLYPCGEGSGFSGGIMSSAADGIGAAQSICNSMLYLS